MSTASVPNRIPPASGSQWQSVIVARDWSDDGLFDVIMLTGSTPILPSAYLDRLNPGGRLFAIVGEGAAMSAHLYTRVAQGAQRDESLFETSVKALRNAPEPERFVF